MLIGKRFSHAEGGGTPPFGVVLTQVLKAKMPLSLSFHPQEWRNKKKVLFTHRIIMVVMVIYPIFQRFCLTKNKCLMAY